LLSRADGGEEAVSGYYGIQLTRHTSVSGELKDLWQSQRRLETVYEATYFGGEVLEDSREIDYESLGHVEERYDKED
jgi:hypothetical protein